MIFSIETARVGLLEFYMGNITDTGNGLLCLNCTSKFLQSGLDPASVVPANGDFPHEICVAISKISDCNGSKPPYLLA